MQWVHTVGTEKPPVVLPKEIKPQAGARGFLGSFWSAFSGASTPQRAPTPIPQAPPSEADPFKISETAVTLAIFMAEVDVRVDKKMTTELERSTKKKPPGRLKYELIYVC